MRVALYARVSKKYGSQDTENQLTQLRQFCHAQGWSITREYVDRKTGKTGDREEFQRLFADASKRKFDMVLFWSLDRFSREGVLATLKYLEQLVYAGVGYRSYTEQYLDSCGIFKDAVLAILAVVAKQERIRTSERTAAGQQRYRDNFATGKAVSHTGKNLPVGRPRKVFDRAAAQAMLNSGRSYGAISRELGVPVTTLHDALPRRVESATEGQQSSPAAP